MLIRLISSGSYLLILSLLTVLLNLSFLSTSARAGDANAYISRFNVADRIYVWPGGYELLVQNLKEEISVEGYPHLEDAAQSMQRTSLMPAVSILVVDTVSPESLRVVLSRSRMQDSIWNEVLSAGTSDDGCSACRFIGDQWVGLGVVLIEKSRLPVGISVQNCTDAAVSYMIGVPAIGGRFDIKAWPSQNAAKKILRAVISCAVSGESAAEPAARTRSGLTPRPTIQCISSNLEK